ncbi:formyl-CoA transferase [Rhodococcus sp. KBW08]|uniref:CaiB/BaiF CoA transferase family protein n=1 Tax=Rhodococcus sp. KBW08 TaxID=2144188 RepID=UPI000F59837F|nr:CoA transferase [Rhodococcus sp. KBW08]RQO46051.1 formyl-CoA transferase [Rhodococcus sp. KBW08]
MNTGDSALKGLRVIDLTTVIMGPFATATLADLGADVVKVESLEGDMSRRMGKGRHEGMSALAMNLHRNKRSIAVDLASQHGRRILDELVRTADVLVTNLRPRSRTKLGISYERLSAINPKLILCTAQAYGSLTDKRDYPAYDDIVQAASGSAKIEELVDGTPRYSPHVIADKVVGLYICVAVTAAIIEKHATGRGQEVDVPMIDSMIGFNLVEHFGGRTFDPPIGEFGWSRVLTPERVPHRTADGWICIMPYSAKNWDDFFALAERPDLTGDPRFASISDRHRSMGDLMTVIRDAAPRHTTGEWLELCSARNIPAADLFDLTDAPADDYVVGQGLVTRREHPTEGVYNSTRTPIRMSRTPVQFVRHAPDLGEHTVEILEEVGYSRTAIRELSDSGAIGISEMADVTS